MFMMNSSYKFLSFCLSSLKLMGPIITERKFSFSPNRMIIFVLVLKQMLKNAKKQNK